MATSYRRTTLQLFALANDAYRNAVVTFYTIDPVTLERTTTLATIYDSPSGGSTLANPYTLSSNGKAPNLIYFDQPLQAVLAETEIGAHETGIIYPMTGDYRGDWLTGTVYLPGQIIKDGANSNNTGNLYIIAAEHTAGVFATDLAADKLALFVDVATLQGYAAAASASADAALASQNAASSSASSASSSASSASSSAAAAAAGPDVVAVTATGNLSDATHEGKELSCTNGSAITLTAPTNLSSDFRCAIYRDGVGTVTVEVTAPDTLNGVSGGSATIDARWTSAYLRQYTEGAFRITGNVTVS